MDLAEAMRIGYKAALSTITVDGEPIPILGLGSVLENQKPPYIIISTFTYRQRMIDKCKVYEGTQLVDIVTTSKSPSGLGLALQIADQVENLINPDSGINIDLTANGYRIGDTNNEQTIPLHDKSNTEYVYRILKRYRHLISKQ